MDYAIEAKKDGVHLYFYGKHGRKISDYIFTWQQAKELRKQLDNCAYLTFVEDADEEIPLCHKCKYFTQYRITGGDIWYDYCEARQGAKPVKPSLVAECHNYKPIKGEQLWESLCFPTGQNL